MKWVLVRKDCVLVTLSLYIELYESPYYPTTRTREGEVLVLLCREALNLCKRMV